MQVQTDFNPASLLAKACLGMLAVCSVFLTGVSHADDADPSSRVARLSYLSGRVEVQTTDDTQWNEARINRPLTSGAELRTDSRGRAELQMGSTSVQVDADTQLRISQLSDDVLQLVVTQGVVNVHIRHLEQRGAVEIETPLATVVPSDSGSYRIEVGELADALAIQVRKGAAEIVADRQDFVVDQDEQLRLLNGNRLTAEFDALPRIDEFDRWAQERNDRAERVASSRYVSEDVIGYEDLDDYGDWRWYSDYGYVWAPSRINTGWAPYRYGHWAWVSPWGWTWIDDAPWGFAPFHYGRWAMLNRRWCWVPGPRSVRAVYAPALVAWVGSPGARISINIGHQPVGWIPLGPREIYRPYYRGSHAYVTRVNLSNSRLNSNEFERGYRHQPHRDDYHNRSATSVVPGDALRAARPVNNHLIRDGHDKLQPVVSEPTRSGNDADVRGNTRSADPKRWHSDRSAERAVSTPDNRDRTQQRDRDVFERRRAEPGNPGVVRERSLPDASAGQDGRIRSSPPVRSELPGRDAERGPDRSVQPAPRSRMEGWNREEARPGNREFSGRVNEQPAPPMPRQRSMPAPSDPRPPMRVAPGPSPGARPQDHEGGHGGRHREQR